MYLRLFSLFVYSRGTVTVSLLGVVVSGDIFVVSMVTVALSTETSVES